MEEEPPCLKSLLYSPAGGRILLPEDKAVSSPNQSTGWEPQAPWERECPVTYHSPCCRTFWKVSFARGRGQGVGWRGNPLRDSCKG